MKNTSINFDLTRNDLELFIKPFKMNIIMRIFAGVLLFGSIFIFFRDIFILRLFLSNVNNKLSLLGLFLVYILYVLTFIIVLNSEYSNIMSNFLYNPYYLESREVYFDDDFIVDKSMNLELKYPWKDVSHVSMTKRFIIFYHKKNSIISFIPISSFSSKEALDFFVDELTKKVKVEKV